MDNDPRSAFDHAGNEDAVESNGRHQVEFKYPLPIFVREHFEPAGLGFSSAHIIDKNVEPAPLLANAIRHRVYAGSCSKVALHEEIGSLVTERWRPCGRGDQGAA